MAATVTMSHDYDAAPRRVWALATDWACLRRVVAGMATFGPLPETPIHAGQTVRTTVSLFGLPPALPYYIEIVEFDDEAMHLKSRESGSISSWEHTIDVEPRNGGCRLRDRLDIVAGWRTPFVAFWARIMLARRHKPRLNMLSQFQGSR